MSRREDIPVLKWSSKCISFYFLDLNTNVQISTTSDRSNKRCKLWLKNTLATCWPCKKKPTARRDTGSIKCCVYGLLPGPKHNMGYWIFGKDDAQTRDLCRKCAHENQERNKDKPSSKTDTCWLGVLHRYMLTRCTTQVHQCSRV